MLRRMLSHAPVSGIGSTRWAAGAAVALAVVELGAALTFQIPLAPVLFAVLLFVAARLIAVGDGSGPLLLVAICASELLLLPGYDRLGAVDWAVQGATGTLAATGALSAGLLLVRGRAAAAIEVRA